jgi:Major Facilitator Superfamily
LPTRLRSAPPATVLAIICLAVTLFPLSLTGASVALPDIASSLHASVSATNWVVSGYNLCFASFMLASGSLADLFGRRRVFRGGVALFVVGSLVGAFSTDILMLDLSRAVAGMGAATALTSGSAVLAAKFEDGPVRRRAFTFFGTAIGVGLAFGPVLAGGLVDALGWRGVFAILGGIGAAVLVASHFLEESSNPAATRVDRWGTACFTTSLFLLIFGLVSAPTDGWGSTWVVGSFVGSVLLFVAFGWVEKVGQEPMFDLSLLRAPRFVGCCVAAMASSMTIVPMLVYLPTYFGAVDGIGAGQAGVILMLLTVPTLLVPLTLGRFPPVPVWVLLGASTALFGPGLFWLTVIQPHAAIMTLAGPMILIGLAIGANIAVLDGAAISSVEASRAGMAAGMFNTVRLASETATIAVVGSLLVTVTQSHLVGRVPSARAAAQAANSGSLASLPPGSVRVLAAGALTGALHDVLWLLGISALIATPLVTVTLRSRRAAEAEVVLDDGAAMMVDMAE